MRQRSPLISLLVIAGLLGCREDMPNEPKREVSPRSRPSAVATPVTPLSGSLVTAPIIPIDIQTGYKDNVRLSGDLACYGDYAARTIRYFRFSTAANVAIPTVYDPDEQCAVFGNLIVHPDVYLGFTENPIYVFDAIASTSQQLEPARTAARYDPAIGGNTVAFFDYFFSAPQVYTRTELRVIDLASPSQSLVLSSTGGVETSPNVSPDGNLIVWEGLDADGYSDVKKVVRSGGVWGAPQSVTSTPFCSEERPDTDGAYIVWTQECDDFDSNVYFQAVSGGPVMKLDLAGQDYNARIDGGVIVFVHGSVDNSSQDVVVYTIATNTLLPVTNTPSVPKARPDVSVLNGGNIRVAWVTLPPSYDNIVQGVTFTPTGGPVGNPTITFGGFGGSFKLPPGLNSSNAGATVPVHFSLGGDHGLNIFSPGSPSSVEVDCKTLATIGSSEAAVGQGGSPLGYNAATGTYSFKWSTKSSWAGTCRKFTMQFTDGPPVFLMFQFK